MGRFLHLAYWSLIGLSNISRWNNLTTLMWAWNSQHGSEFSPQHAVGPLWGRVACKVEIKAHALLFQVEMGF